MALEWPDWGKIVDYNANKNFAAGNPEFTTFKKTVLKASVDDIDKQAPHAGAMWEFLIGFAAIKKMYRNLIIQVFNKLMQVPSWVAAWNAEPRLKEQMKTLHEGLQAALAAQSETLQDAVTPAALASMSKEDFQKFQPEVVQQAMVKEQMLDEIREEEAAATETEGRSQAPPRAGGQEVFGQEAAATEAAQAAEGGLSAGLIPVSDFQAGIDAAVACNSTQLLLTGGQQALNQLRIGCIQCAGQETTYQQEVNHAFKVFSFLINYTQKKPEDVSKVAEVMNQLMASPSWSAYFQSSPTLKKNLKGCTADAQAALGLQSEKVMELISDEAQAKARRGEVPAAVKSVVEKMRSVRVSAPAAAAAAAPPPKPTAEWNEAKTPEGHIYYYSTRTNETTWERPAALGGPYRYKVGDEVEVWSNSQKAWGRGKVERVAGDVVTAEFTMPGGSAAKKELPSSHKDLRLAQAVTEGWSAEEAALYRGWYDQLEGPGGGGKPAMAVGAFMKRSGLPSKALKQVWAVANPQSKGELSLEDFSRCCRLLAHCQALGGAKIVLEAERPLRVKLREECAGARPPALPKIA